MTCNIFFKNCFCELSTLIFVFFILKNPPFLVTWHSKKSSYQNNNYMFIKSNHWSKRIQVWSKMGWHFKSYSNLFASSDKKLIFAGEKLKVWNHQLLLLFWINFFLRSYYGIYCLALWRRFWPYLLLKFVKTLVAFIPMFLAKDKHPYPFPHMPSLGLFEYLIFIQWNCIQWLHYLITKVNFILPSFSFYLLLLMVDYFDLYTILHWTENLS